jgi:hypothetical protein
MRWPRSGRGRPTRYWRRAWVFDNQRLILLDGTANPEILRQFVPHLEGAPEIRVRRNARVIQVSNSTFYKGRLIRRGAGPNGKGKPEATARLLEVGDFIEKIARADVAHFGNLRGSNEFEGHETVIILGRDEPTVRDAERRAMAIWYDTREPIRRIRPDIKGRFNYRTVTRRYLRRDGSTRPGNVSAHPDPRVQAVVEQGREAEMVQAIDRLRLVHTKKRKTVYILCSIPLDIPVDQFVTWRAWAGDSRLTDARGLRGERLGGSAVGAR